MSLPIQPMEVDFPHSSHDPYERQERGRTCGPACLRMLYGRFGVAAGSQNEVWLRVQIRDLFRPVGSQPYRLAADARWLGLHAIALAGRDPERFLDLATQRLGVVIRHRMEHRPEAWHFAVLRRVAERRVWMHDPLTGPDRRYDRAAFVDLWGESVSAAPGPAWQLVAVSPFAQTSPVCAVCGDDIPATARCPVCWRSVALRPAEVLGCVREACEGRLWRAIFCPDCGQPFENITEPKREGIDMADVDKLVKLGEALDQYQAVAADLHRTMPPGETRDRIQTLMGQIQEGYARLVPAITEQREQVKAAQAEASRLRAEAQAKIEEGKAKRDAALAKARAPKEKPVKPLDPALGERLRELLLREAGRAEE